MGEIAEEEEENEAEQPSLFESFKDTSLEE